MGKFDRWKPRTFQEKNINTIPFLRFKVFHTELNSMYWASRASVKAAYSLTENHAKNDSMSQTFDLEPREYGYRELTLEKWGSAFSDFQNWTRLNAVMSLSAYFEYYLQAVTTLAIESNPGCLLDQTIVIDGCTIMKKRDDYSFFHETTPFVKGVWSSRKSAFVKTFRGCPQILEDNIGELDKMRNLRNDLGHAFGRGVFRLNDANETLSKVEFVPMKRLGEERLKKWLGLVFQIAEAVDFFLQKDFIGAYDVLKTYHYWYKENSAQLPTKGHSNSIIAETSKRFREYYHDGVIDGWGGGGMGLNKEYMKGLISYYRNI